MEETKRCPQCGLTKPVEQFIKKHAYCRPCHRLYQKTWRAGPKRRFVAPLGFRRCTKCRRVLLLSAFSRAGKSGWHVYCRECKRAYDAIFTKTVKQRHRRAQYMRAFRNGEGGEQGYRWAVREFAKFAVYLGILIRQPCEVCGEVKVQAHHDDYTKPLDARWLCRLHHNHAHGKLHDLAVT